MREPEHPCSNHKSANVLRFARTRASTPKPLFRSCLREPQHPCSNHNSAHVLRFARTRAKAPAKFPETSLRGSRFSKKRNPAKSRFYPWGPPETSVNYSVFRLAHVFPEVKTRQDARSERGLGLRVSLLYLAYGKRPAAQTGEATTVHGQDHGGAVIPKVNAGLEGVR